ncbi:hypothetical protein [Methylobacterium sp. WSM2598]|uniref:hypothetical protein n=1 Tax=Methylobacterium sp. WSM2598 TaxID=398261 RepID=UPI00036E7634|nr:hypothetical protein [Methylobacterium sp. WSM2598]
MISTRLHAAIDYTVPALVTLLAAGPGRSPAARRLMRAVSGWNYAYSLCTSYEGGLVRAIPMRGHLALDTAGALAYLGSAALGDRLPARDRLLLAGIGAAQLAVIGLSNRGGARSTPANRQ